MGTVIHSLRNAYGLMIIYLHTVAKYTLIEIAELINQPVDVLRAAKITDFIPSTLDSEIKLIKLFNKALRLKKQKIAARISKD